MATFRGKPMLSWTSQGQPELPRKSWWKSCWNHPKFGSSSYPLDVWTHPNFESWNITQLYFRWCFWMFPAINLHCVGLFCRFPWNPQPPAPSLGVSSSLGTRDPRVGQTGDRNYKIFRTFNVMFNVIFNTIVTIQMIQNDSIWFNMIQPFPTTTWGTDRCGSLHSCLSEFPFRERNFCDLLVSRWPNLVFPKVFHLDARNVGCWPFVHHHFTKAT